MDHTPEDDLLQLPINDTPDFSAVQKMVTEFIHDIATYGMPRTHAQTTLERELFDAVVEAYYGEDVWKKIDAVLEDE